MLSATLVSLPAVSVTGAKADQAASQVVPTSAAWERSTLTYSGRREPEGAEQMSLYPDHVVICCSTPRGKVELAMNPSSLMGFQSWLEAGPPGASY